MNKEQIVTISRRDDAHLELVQAHLDNEMILIDPRAVLEGAELTYDVRDGVPYPRYDQRDLMDVGSVWYRKPETITEEDLPDAVASRYRAYGAMALNKHIELLYASFPNATWVSDFYAIQQASNKILQYKEARNAGFRVPDTTLTSHTPTARQFIADHPDSIVKTLSPIYFRDANGTPKVFLTRKVDATTNVNNLHLAPGVFQERVDGTYIRVTVVGDQVFAALELVDKDLQEKYGPEIYDSRLGQVEGDPNLEPFETFPEEAKNRCVFLTKQLGLRFGAIDLIMDRKGELWFLEINPNGQWGYVEQATGQQIGKEVARLLVERDK